MNNLQAFLLGIIAAGIVAIVVLLYLMYQELSILTKP